MLWMVQRVVFGKIKKEENARLKDLSAREVGLLIPLLVLMLLMGVYPRPFLDRTRASVNAVRLRVTPQTGGVFEARK
jgi:NADH-quinone oxidoreductase subunit M